ncbi:hypothetical protein E1B28_000382 [Marasmius oreades]|uniref:Uncharacterized protein n=1 Tax=Marasmius oreades TaxID=181124 RepID=A0A9P8AEI9_9AGAR|nr:uncharacterized protein E1B28_000382 [Marasmius oreades]KAG7098430.1 hypothetical protein E1B28_000382 [Marasmius oreades]
MDAAGDVEVHEVVVEVEVEVEADVEMEAEAEDMMTEMRPTREVEVEGEEGRRI